jgi:hypothetical protein
LSRFDEFFSSEKEKYALMMIKRSRDIEPDCNEIDSPNKMILKQQYEEYPGTKDKDFEDVIVKDRFQCYKIFILNTSLLNVHLKSIISRAILLECKQDSNNKMVKIIVENISEKLKLREKRLHTRMLGAQKEVGTILCQDLLVKLSSKTGRLRCHVSQ